MVERGGGAASVRGGCLLYSLGFGGRGSGGDRGRSGRRRCALVRWQGREMGPCDQTWPFGERRQDLLSGDLLSSDLPPGDSSAFESLTWKQLASTISLRNEEGRSLHVAVSCGKSQVRPLVSILRSYAKIISNIWCLYVFYLLWVLVRKQYCILGFMILERHGDEGARYFKTKQLARFLLPCTLRFIYKH